MKMNDGWHDIYNKDTYISSTLGSLTKPTRSRKCNEFKDILPWNISQIHKDRSNQHKNSHKLYDEKVQPLLSLKERDQNFPTDEKTL